jgi:hypothetical protein
MPQVAQRPACDFNEKNAIEIIFLPGFVKGLSDIKFSYVGGCSMRLISWALGAVVVLIGLGCIPQGINPPRACTMIYVYGVNVNVVDALTGLPVPNATAVITDLGYSEVLQSFDPSTGEFTGAGERPGTYTLSVSAPGYQTVITGPLQVGFDGCHVIPVSLTVSLQPI